MAYIEPRGNIKIIFDCPCDSHYEHTIHFTDEVSQHNYFLDLDGLFFSNQSYQRYAKGALSINTVADTVIKANYLMFQNSNFTDAAGNSKWFYAFITKVEYVNNNTTRVYYELDVIQTWLFDMSLGRCFIERTHAETDYPGDNLIEENLETGDFYLTKLNASQFPFTENAYSIIIWHAVDLQKTSSGTYNCVLANVFNGVGAHIFTSPSDAYQYLKDLAGKEDSVVAINMIPTSMVRGLSSYDTFRTTVDYLFFEDDIRDPYKEITVSGKKQLMRPFGTYIPINNKLYTSPYFGMLVTSSDGASKKYAYEYFNVPNEPTLARRDSISPTPVSALYPYNYKGVQRNFNEELTCKNFPLCSWSSDAFKAWLAQNTGALVASGVGMGLSTLGGLASIAAGNIGAVIPTVTGTLSNVASMLGQIRDRSVAPDKARGDVGDYLSYTRNNVGFTLYRYQIREEYARIIDAYFNVYGYASHQVAVPNLSVRPHWTYIKTKNCVLNGAIPGDDHDKITEIFNSGITFWKNGNEVGNYSLDNRPV